MARKRILAKHPVEGGVDLVLGNFPRHQSTLGQVRCKQGLSYAPDRARPQHGGNPRHHHIDSYTRARRNFLKRFAHESFDFVL